jgi:hypothetical protein
LALAGRRLDDLGLVGRQGLLANVAPSSVSPGPDGDAVGDAVDPVTKEPTVTNRFRTIDQYQKRRLESIFDVVLVVEDATAYAEDHPTVTRHERRKCHLVAFNDKSFQKFVIIQARNCPLIEDPIQLAQDDPRIAAHERLPPHVDGLFTLHSALGAISNLTFFRISSK